MTLAVGTVNDNAHGQREMLGDCITNGIAAEIGELLNSGVIGIAIDDAAAVDSEGSLVLVNHCSPVACFDLAVARAMRACRGKAACLCGCQTLAALQSYPDDESTPAVPAVGDSLEEWRAAEAVLHRACSYGTDQMSYKSLKAPGHVYRMIGASVETGLGVVCTRAAAGVSGRRVTKEYAKPRPTSPSWQREQLKKTTTRGASPKRS
eukprot:6202481-Pleurochrysis_carterae.AAC.1